MSSAFTANRLGNFSPRLGLVCNPDGKGRTTFRAGAALLYDSVGAFIPYRMVAQNPHLRFSGHSYLRPVRAIVPGAPG